MRANKGSGTGPTGQSRVEAVFEEFDWAVHPVDQQHDWGTDLWVMPFDDERYSTASLVGVQVKTSSTMSGKYFKEPAKNDEGRVTGWWFRPDKADHLHEWRRHSVPHIVAICCLSTGEIYWERITDSTIVDTPTSGKVLISASNKLAASRAQLLAIAAEGRRQALWEGTAWESSTTLTPNERLRAAFICPRLVSPHPNHVSGPLTPPEALAMLVQVRLDELDRKHPMRARELVPTYPGSHRDWRWRLYDALHTYLRSSDEPDVFDLTPHLASTTDEHVTVTAVHAAALMEHGRPADALRLLQHQLENDDLEPLDRLWLGTHQAWSMYELGRTDAAVALASELQITASLRRPDPTAAALGASLADLVFASKRSLAAADLAAVLNANDTAADWWREQTLGRGGIARADADFKAWAQPSNSPAQERAAWRALRSATLMAVLAANRNGWRRSSQRLAQEQLMGAEVSEETTRDSLQMLRHAGATAEVEMVARRLLDYGPSSHLQEAARDVDLERSTTTSLSADIALLQRAGDVLDADTAGRTLNWVIETLSDIDAFELRRRPMFLVAPKALDLAAAICPALSTDAIELLHAHLAAMPPQEDQLTARGYAAVLDSLPPDHWSQDLVRDLGRRDRDNHELGNEIERLVATRDPQRRRALLSRIRDGDLAALHAFGDVRELPAEVASQLVASLTSSVAEMVERAPGYTVSDYLPLHTLTLINVRHPHVAAWPPVIEALKQGAGSRRDLANTLRLLSTVPDLLPIEHRPELTSTIRSLSAHALTQSFFDNIDVASIAKATLDVLEPGTTTLEELLEMLNGDSANRANAVLILARRKDPADLPLIAAAAILQDARTTAMVSHCMARWICDDLVTDQVFTLLRPLLTDCGVAIATSVTSILDEAPRSAGADRLADLLANHVSARARIEVSRYRGRADTRNGLPTDQTDSG